MKMLRRMLGGGTATVEAALGASAMQAGLDTLAGLAHAQRVLAAQTLIERLLARSDYADPRRLERSGYKGWSQNDEDGILAEIFRRIGIDHHAFIEFGVGDGCENNSVALLTQGWRGLWVEGDEAHAASIRHNFSPLIQASLLHFSHSFVTRENAATIAAAAGLGAGIDLLSIDLDGNDYHVWEALANLNPRVVVVEYNAKFRPPADWVWPYREDNVWNATDAFGASLCAFDRMARSRGYQLVGCNLTGANAFFVRTDLARDRFFEPAAPHLLFQPPRYELMFGFPCGHSASAATIVAAALSAQRRTTA